MNSRVCYLLLVFVLTIQQLCAQFAIVQDKDGFVNVRESAGKDGKLIDTLQNEHIVLCEGEETPGWMTVFYNKQSDGSLMGYIHNSRLLPLSALASVPIINKTQEHIQLQKDSISITVAVVNFQAYKYQLEYSQGEGSHLLTKVNGKAFWGTDGGMPRKAYRQINVLWSGKKVVIPTAAWSDLFEPNLGSCTAHYDKLKERLYISSHNSDGAGSYSVVWIIDKGVYRQRIVLLGF